jgi:UDP-N-acetylmuramyl pentapeptide synthase
MAVSHLVKPLKRFVKKHLRPGWRAVACSAFAAWRRCHRRCRFIGVTGSSAKTTTVSLIDAVLSRHLPGVKGPGSINTPWMFHHTLFRLRARHRYCVQEVGLGAERTVRIYARVLKPDIAVVTHVQSDHIKSYGSLEAIAEEKGRLVAALGPQGVAVLNADDPLVAGMAARTRARVIRYGLGEGADLRAGNVTSRWPEPLRFTATHAGTTCEVTTRLHGAHWVHSALAAVGCGMAMGMTLREAADALAAAEPTHRRMSPVTTPDGVTFLVDDMKSPAWATPTAFDVLRDARATRRIIVLGTLSEVYGNVRVKHRHVALQACASADIVVVAGAWAHYAMRSYDAKDGPLRAYETFAEALAYLRTELRPGDLVLLKGNSSIDHFDRIIADRAKRVACELTRCGRRTDCADCRRLYRA